MFVDTAFRSTPWAQEAAESDSARTAARVLFVSESGVCRSVLAQALLRRALHVRGLDDSVECEARGTRRALGSGASPRSRQQMRPGECSCYLARPWPVQVLSTIHCSRPCNTGHEQNRD